MLHFKYGTEDNIIYNNGYPTTYRGKTFSWDRNMLSSYTNNYGTTCSFTYDVYGKRIKTQYGSSQASYFFYDGDRLIAEHMYMLNQSTPTLKVHYLYDNEGVCACKIYYKDTNNNEYAYYTVTKDIFGNIIRLDGEEGCVLKITYSAFGEPTYEIGEPMKVGITGLNAPQNYFRLAYKGYFYDKDLKLYYLMSRYYDPETGRFISPDAIEYLDPSTIGGLNLYSYCNNNPVMYVDPSGQSWESFWSGNGNWFADNWVKLAIGAAFIVGGAIVAFFTAGMGTAGLLAAGGALLASAKAVGISMAVSAGIGTVVGAITGGWEGALQGFSNGLADGFMWGGIFSGSAQILGGASKLLASRNVNFSDKFNWLFGNRNSQSTTLLRVNKGGKQLFRIDASVKELWHLHYGATAALMRIHRTQIVLFGYLGIANILKGLSGGF